MGTVFNCCSEESQRKSKRLPQQRKSSKRQSSSSQKVKQKGNHTFKLEQKASGGQKVKPFPIFQKYSQKKVLGKVSTGTVVLVQQNKTQKKLAMKIISKNTLNEHNILQTNIINKIKNNDFLTNIVEVRQYGQNIYIVMEYLPKGDLYFYIQKDRKDKIQLSDACIKGVLAQIIVALSFLHQRGIVYLHLKPQNLLITDEGHIKLTDYILSKQLENQQRKGVCTFKGPIEYMAPQVIKGPFGYEADIWALGIVAFEIKFRQNLLQRNGKVDNNFSDFEELMNSSFIEDKINDKIGHMSQQFRELLKRLLQKDPTKRISLKQLQSHPYFEHINWEQVRSRQNPPLLGQIIKADDSIRYRDITSETSKRISVEKRHNTPQRQFQFKLIEVESE